MKKLFKGMLAIIFVAVICLTASVGCLALGVVFGDANANNTVDILDLIRVKKYAANQTDVISFDAVDFDYNGNVDAHDITIVRKILLSDNAELGINSENLEDILVTTIG